MTQQPSAHVEWLTGLSLRRSALSKVIQTVPSRDGAWVGRTLTEEVETLRGDDHFHPLGWGHTLVE